MRRNGFIHAHLGIAVAYCSAAVIIEVERFNGCRRRDISTRQREAVRIIAAVADAKETGHLRVRRDRVGWRGLVGRDGKTYNRLHGHRDRFRDGGEILARRVLVSRFGAIGNNRAAIGWIIESARPQFR